MDRIARFDFSSRFARPLTRHAAQIGFGVACTGAMVLVRAELDLLAQSSGPFALVYPTVVLATLFGHWRAGLAAYVLSFLWAWYVVLPDRWSFHFANPDDISRTIINAVSVLVILLACEGFRKAGETYRDEMRRALDRRLVLLAELEHRTKNNFALVASLLEIQRRRVEAPEAARALDDAIGRVRTFAGAYSNLAMEQEEGSEVSMKPYLDQLLDRLSAASFHPGVEVERAIADIHLRREVGVAIGLYLNEALANCAKYAFAEGREGTVRVEFGPAEKGWQLVVEDDGPCHSPRSGGVASTPGGLGANLMAAFAQQARAEHVVASTKTAYRLTLRSPAG